MQGFNGTALKLVIDLKENLNEYSKSKQLRILSLDKLIYDDPKLFVKEYKKLSGATNWDLPDVIYSQL